MTTGERVYERTGLGRQGFDRGLPMARGRADMVVDWRAGRGRGRRREGPVLQGAVIWALGPSARGRAGDGAEGNAHWRQYDVDGGQRYCRFAVTFATHSDPRDATRVREIGPDAVVCCHPYDQVLGHGSQ